MTSTLTSTVNNTLTRSGGIMRIKLMRLLSAASASDSAGAVHACVDASTML